MALASDQEEDGEDTGAAVGIGNVTVKRALVKFSKKDIVMEGGMAAAELVDYLINQRDRNSYAILPEIYSPGPFIYGTLRKNDSVVSGPCRTGRMGQVHQIRISGVVFPRALKQFVGQLAAEGHQVTLVVDREPHTDFLTRFVSD